MSGGLKGGKGREQIGLCFRGGRGLLFSDDISDGANRCAEFFSPLQFRLCVMFESLKHNSAGFPLFQPRLIQCYCWFYKSRTAIYSVCISTLVDAMVRPKSKTFYRSHPVGKINTNRACIVTNCTWHSRSPVRVQCGRNRTPRVSNFPLCSVAFFFFRRTCVCTSSVTHTLVRV